LEMGFCELFPWTGLKPISASQVARLQGRATCDVFSSQQQYSLHSGTGILYGVRSGSGWTWHPPQTFLFFAAAKPSGLFVV
jgi:hypothetical protein